MAHSHMVFLWIFLTCVGTWANRSVSKTTSPQRNLRLSNLYWNTSNPIFRIDNTDHIIDVNQDVKDHEYDRVNIICPVYHQDVPMKDTERYVIYNVNKEEYETCRILTPHPRIVAGCTDPYKERFFTISFRSFSPMPNTMEFKAGEDYYFISTSSKEDMHRRIHGDCRNHNMKVVFKVGPRAEEPEQRHPSINDLLQWSTTARPPTSIKFYTRDSEGDSRVNRPHNYTTYFFDSEGNKFGQEINTRLDEPGTHVSLVKKVRDKIKQEASTKISAGHLAYLSPAVLFTVIAAALAL